MPRFTDEWLIDRVLIDYMSGGACACCGLQHLFMPNGLQDLIHAVSDIETDQAAAAVAWSQQQQQTPNKTNPWPEELQSQVWADRVKLRQLMKKEMTQHEQFWHEYGTEFVAWFEAKTTNDGEDNDTSPPTVLQRIFQLPKSEIMTVLQEKYNIHSAFGVVLCGILEQVAQYDLTAYPPDGKGTAELQFESILQFKKLQGGFTLDRRQEENWKTIWLERMRTLGGPKLLMRKHAAGKDKDDNDDDDEGEADDRETEEKAPASSNNKSDAGFASDRRIVRLMIARYWAELLQKRFLEERNKEDVSAS